MIYPPHIPERIGGEGLTSDQRARLAEYQSAADEFRRADAKVKTEIELALERVKHIGENLPRAGYAERHNRYYDLIAAVESAVNEAMPEEM